MGAVMGFENMMPVDSRREMLKGAGGGLDESDWPRRRDSEFGESLLRLRYHRKPTMRSTPSTLTATAIPIVVLLSEGAR